MHLAVDLFVNLLLGRSLVNLKNEKVPFSNSRLNRDKEVSWARFPRAAPTIASFFPGALHNPSLELRYSQLLQQDIFCPIFEEILYLGHHIADSFASGLKNAHGVARHLRHI
jgi:hypothetical protein